MSRAKPKSPKRSRAAKPTDEVVVRAPAVRLPEMLPASELDDIFHEANHLVLARLRDDYGPAIKAAVKGEASDEDRKPLAALVLELSGG